MEITFEEIIKLIRGKSKTLFILCGLPYSGKSYISKKILSVTDVEFINIDDVFYSRGYDWTTNKLPDQKGWDEIFQETFDASKRALQQSKSVLYDSTNHTRASRDKLREIAKEVGAEAVVIFIDIPSKVMWARWEQNKSNHQRPVIAKDLVQMTVDSFERPAEDENIYFLRNG